MMRNILELLTEIKDDMGNTKEQGIAKVSQDYRKLFYKESTQQWIRDYYKEDFNFILKMRHGIS